MKNKLIKKIALVMSFITMLGTLPVNAYELDSRGMSIESVEYQNSEDEDFVNASEVFAEIGSTYQVTIPKVLVNLNLHSIKYLPKAILLVMKLSLFVPTEL